APTRAKNTTLNIQLLDKFINILKGLIKDRINDWVTMSDADITNELEKLTLPPVEQNFVVEKCLEYVKRARVKRDEKILREAERKQQEREEAERKQREEAERKQREEAERKQQEREEAERKQREEAERKQREEAERKQLEILTHFYNYPGLRTLESIYRKPIPPIYTEYAEKATNYIKQIQNVCETNIKEWILKDGKQLDEDIETTILLWGEIEDWAKKFVKEKILECVKFAKKEETERKQQQEREEAARKRREQQEEKVCEIFFTELARVENVWESIKDWNRLINERKNEIIKTITRKDDNSTYIKSIDEKLQKFFNLIEEICSKQNVAVGLYKRNDLIERIKGGFESQFKNGLPWVKSFIWAGIADCLRSKAEEKLKNIITGDKDKTLYGWILLSTNEKKGWIQEWFKEKEDTKLQSI
ncbi:MAG: hypothetical protein EB023_14330, partial [Flavobacteriia bacterium]|nr:hypothetical protein [Flavobacteriia bacterium]